MEIRKYFIFFTACFILVLLSGIIALLFFQFYGVHTDIESKDYKYKHESEKVKYQGDLTLKEGKIFDLVLQVINDESEQINNNTKWEIELALVNNIDIESFYKLIIEEDSKYDAIEVISGDNLYLSKFDKTNNQLFLYLVVGEKISKPKRYEMIDYALYRFVYSIKENRLNGFIGQDGSIGDLELYQKLQQVMEEENKNNNYIKSKIW